MIQAILHGKVSTEIQRSEDVLTSNIFGLLLALELEQGLSPWFRQARRTDGTLLDAEFAGYTCKFWPSLELPDSTRCEPDLLLIPPLAKKPVGFVECKFFSGPSGFPTDLEDTEIRGQIGRQWLALTQGWRQIGAVENTNIFPGFIIYLTRDWIIPTALLEEMIEEIEDKASNSGCLRECLYWVSWRSLGTVLTKSPTDTPVGKRLQAMILELLKHLELVSFDGCPEPCLGEIKWHYMSPIQAPKINQISWKY